MFKQKSSKPQPTLNEIFEGGIKRKEIATMQAWCLIGAVVLAIIVFYHLGYGN